MGTMGIVAADFSEMSEVRRVADAAGEIDVLVNCAGFVALGPTADTDEAAFDGLFQINVTWGPESRPAELIYAR